MLFMVVLDAALISFMNYPIGAVRHLARLGRPNLGPHAGRTARAIPGVL